MLVGFRRNHVVGVQEREELTASVLDAEVAGDSLTGIGLGEDSDARLGALVLPQDIETAICRSVVDADDLEIPQRLTQGAVEALTQVGRHVVDRHDDREVRPGTCSSGTDVGPATDSPNPSTCTRGDDTPCRIVEVALSTATRWFRGRHLGS